MCRPQKTDSKLRFRGMPFQLQKLLNSHPGSTKTVFCVVINNGERYVFIERKNSGVEISAALVRQIGSILGPRHCKLKVTPPEQPQRRRWNPENARNNG